VTAVKDLAPAPVVVSARLDASQQVGGGADEAVVGSVVLQGVRVAPPHVEISNMGSVSGSQPGQYVRPSDGVSRV